MVVRGDERLDLLGYLQKIRAHADKINYSIFDKLSQLNQREIVENKRLGSVLAHIQQQHEQLEHQNKRNRSQKMPRRQAQKTAIEQRNLNPVLDLEMSI